MVERALEIAALMLGSDKSRGYSLEMICADFLAHAVILCCPESVVGGVGESKKLKEDRNPLDCYAVNR